MISKTIAAGLIAATALTAVPAKADSFAVQFGFGAPSYGWNHGHWDRGHHDRDRDRRHGPVSPREVRWILQGRGYDHIRFVDRRGAVYQVRASKNGRDFFLVVSARNGDIVSRNRI
jgi:hypothetical protein